VSVQGRSLDGDPVQLERAGLALPVLAAAAWDALAEDEVVARRLAELATADALARVNQAAGQGDWDEVERLLEQARIRFAGNPWVDAMLATMKDVADSRVRQRMMKEAAYSSSRLRSRLASKVEAAYSAAEEMTQGPSYLRRKPAQGKGGL
jgi:hypothetical protein